MHLDIPLVPRKCFSSKRQMVISINSEKVFGRCLKSPNIEMYSNLLWKKEKSISGYEGD